MMIMPKKKLKMRKESMYLSIPQIAQRYVLHSALHDAAH